VLDIKKTIQLLLIMVLLSSIACSDKSASDYARDYSQSGKDTCIGKVSMHLKRTKLNYVEIHEKPDTLLIFTKNSYSLLPEKSELEWFCGKHTGLVMMKNGSFRIEKKQIVAGEFSVDMDSIYDVDIDNDLMRGTLENILRSEDFFDVKKFPVSTFIIDSIVKIQGNSFQISGILKIRDIEKKIRFKSLLNISLDTLFAESEKFTIDRTNWQINHMSKKYAKNEDEFVFTDSLQFIVHITAVAE